MIHKPSEDTYNFISQWIAPDFFFSITDVWHRMGFLGVFGDYVLSHLQGDILEIGVGESSIYLSALARKYNRRIHYCDIEHSKIINPLTIAGYLAPERGIFFKCSSDEMFRSNNISPIAIAFIDGWHSYEQVKKDFYNTLQYLVPGGFILLHDTCPPSQEYINENKCGDVYLFREELEKDEAFDILSLPKGTAMGVGLSIVRKR
jgi:hypothetical protein